MAKRFYLMSVMTPANTTQISPLSTSWPLEDGILEQVELIVPSGHNGLTGIRLLQSFQQIIPWANDQFLTANNEQLVIPYQGEMTGSGITIQTYNTDVFDHSFYLRALLSDIPTLTQAGFSTVNVIDNGSLSGPPPPTVVTPNG